MTCSQCGYENPTAARFCNQCAASFARVCGACGAESPPESRFCNQCAASLVVTVPT